MGRVQFTVPRAPNDVPIPASELRKKRLHRGLAVALAVGGALGLTYGASQLSTKAPVFQRRSVWVDTVKRGPMVREVQGVGALVPDDDAFLWIAAEIDGRVDRKWLQAGAAVEAETILMELSNPEVEQAAVAAKLALSAAEAAYKSLVATLENDLRQQRSALAAIEGDWTQASMQAEVDEALARDGLLSTLTAQQSTVKAGALKTRLEIEKERLAAAEESLADRLAVQKAEVDSRRTLAALRQRDVEALRIRAGMSGVLQEVVVDAGERVGRSVNLARVADPSRLKAELRIPEAQTQDLRPGLKVTVDTYNGLVDGRVERIAPTAQNGTVTIDVALTGPLPDGARLDMTIDGTIELERLDDVLHVGRPTTAAAQGEVTLFKLSADESLAERTSVRLGRISAAEVEILSGLSQGDRVVLSDVAAWSQFDVVRLE